MRLVVWSELPEPNLFILNESALRALSWSESIGYLLIADVPSQPILVAETRQNHWMAASG